MRRIYPVIVQSVGASLLGVLLFAPFYTVRAAQISLTATNPSPKVNERFAITINLAGGDQTLGTDVVLRYDSQRLIIQEVVEGTLYPTYNPAGAARVNKDAGLIVLSGSTGFGQSVSANGVFGSISFVALKDGPTTISLDYEPGTTNKTGVIGPKGEEFLTSAPSPLVISVKRQSLLGALLSFFQSLWKKQ